MRLVRIWYRLNGWPRRLVAAALLLLAGFSAVHSTRTRAEPIAGADVLVAAHDLAAGTAIDADDVRIASWPASARPTTALTAKDAVGRRLAGPIGTGEVITSTRLVGTDLSAGLPAGMIAVAVPLVDSGTAGLIHAGNHVDLLAPPSDMSAQATVVVSRVLVLAVLPHDPSAATTTAQLVVAIDQTSELRIAQAITTPMLATLIKPP